jgi:hypothetical protein
MGVILCQSHVRCVSFDFSVSVNWAVTLVWASKGATINDTCRILELSASDERQVHLCFCLLGTTSREWMQNMKNIGNLTSAMAVRRVSAYTRPLFAGGMLSSCMVTLMRQRRERGSRACAGYKQCCH